MTGKDPEVIVNINMTKKERESIVEIDTKNTKEVGLIRVTFLTERIRRKEIIGGRKVTKKNLR